MLCLLPGLALAQPPAEAPSPPPPASEVPATPPRSDTPDLPLQDGQTLRVTTRSAVLTGKLTSLKEGVLRLTLRGGRPSAVPTEALLQVEVRQGRTRAGARAGALGGAVLFAIAGGVFCTVQHELNDDSSVHPLPVPACIALAGLGGAGLGALFGAAIGSTSYDWELVYRRPLPAAPSGVR